MSKCERIEEVTRRRQFVSLASGVALLLLFASYPFFAPEREDWDYVGSIPDRNRGRIGKILATKNIDPLWNGQTLYVPKGMRNKVLPELAAAGLLPDRGTGYWDWLYGENDIDPRRKTIAKSIDAKERELSSWIVRTYPVVSRADVTLTPAADTAKPRTGKRAKASVTVSYAGGGVLTDGQVTAIAGMIAASMKNLAPHEVAILDRTGARGVPDPDSQLAKSNERVRAATRWKRDYEDKIRRALAPLASGVAVAVTVELAAGEPGPSRKTTGFPSLSIGKNETIAGEVGKVHVRLTFDEKLSLGDDARNKFVETVNRSIGLPGRVTVDFARAGRAAATPVPAGRRVIHEEN